MSQLLILNYFILRSELKNIIIDCAIMDQSQGAMPRDGWLVYAHVSIRVVKSLKTCAKDGASLIKY